MKCRFVRALPWLALTLAVTALLASAPIAHAIEYIIGDFEGVAPTTTFNGLPGYDGWDNNNTAAVLTTVTGVGVTHGSRALDLQIPTGSFDWWLRWDHNDSLTPGIDALFNTFTALKFDVTYDRAQFTAVDGTNDWVNTEWVINTAAGWMQSKPSFDSWTPQTWEPGTWENDDTFRHPSPAADISTMTVTLDFTQNTVFPSTGTSSWGTHFPNAVAGHTDWFMFFANWQTGASFTDAHILIDNIRLVAPDAGDADFDDDTDIDADDIDILADMIFRGGADPGGQDTADLDGVGGVTQDDMDYMVNTVLETVYGDADLDDDVDGADFDAWRIRDSLGGGIGWATGDWDGDNDVDGADFDHWRLRLPSIGGGGVAAVPEPGTLVLMGLAVPTLVLAARRRKA